MKINNFLLQVRPGTEDETGYVEMSHNTQYRIVIGNAWSTRAIATLEIDGKFINRYVVQPFNRIELETNESNGGKFTFLAKGTPEFLTAELQYVSEQMQGVITCSIAPEKFVQPVVSQEVSSGSTVRGIHQSYSMGGSMDAGPTIQSSLRSIKGTSSIEGQSLSGGTGLTGQSDQRFQTVASFPLNESERTILNLRLILPRVKPLRPTVILRGNPVPPPL